MTGSAHLSAGEVIEEFISVYRVPLFLILTSVISTGTATLVLIKSQSVNEPLRIVESTQSAVLGEASEIMVDVAGAVTNPGVYNLPEGSRLDDAIRSAGGLTAAADTEYLARTVNRALRVNDGMKIYVPSKTGKTISKSEQNISEIAVVSDPARQVSVNSASQSELEALNGIGEKTAEKIIAGRPYLTLEELVEKKVITRSLLEKLAGELGL